MLIDNYTKNSVSLDSLNETLRQNKYSLYFWKPRVIFGDLLFMTSNILKEKIAIFVDYGRTLF